MLSSQQIAFYHADGYLKLEGVLSSQEVGELQRVTDEFVERAGQVSKNDEVFDLEPHHTLENPRLRRVKSPATQHPVYDRILRHDAILDIVAQLIGPAIRTNGNKLNMKSAGYGSQVEWHQDWSFYPHTNDDLLAVGVAIDDMYLDNGCLLVAPGSHRGPLFDHHHDGAFAGAVTEPNFQVDSTAPIELKAGGISVHHVRLLHGSTRNVSRRSRRLLLLQYCAVDAWPLTGVSEWDQFNRNILRGDPTNQPRLADVPIRMPLPRARPGSIYEAQSVLERGAWTQSPKDSAGAGQ